MNEIERSFSIYITKQGKTGFTLSLMGYGISGLEFREFL